MSSADGSHSDEGSSPVTLYRHDPLTLLPLLKQHLPYSLPVYGTIKANPFRPFPSSWTNSPEAGLPITELHFLSQDEIISSAWCTFPPGELNSVPEVWTVIIHLPRPLSKQTRVYNSVQRVLTPTLSAKADGTTATPSLTEPTYELWRAGQRSVQGTVKLLAQHSPVLNIVGALSILFTSGVRGIYGTAYRGICDSWLAHSAPASSAEEVDQEGGAEGSEADKEGLVLDIGRPQDCEAIASTRDIKEDVAYYLSRLPYTTVIRDVSGAAGAPTGAPLLISSSIPPATSPSASPLVSSSHTAGTVPPAPAAAWIITHSAGDQGALFTLPLYRRRGLAKWVVSARLADYAVKTGVRGYVFVFRGNEASEGLWKGMGWERGWGVEWVYLR